RSDPERRSTAASPLDVGILEVEARRHELALEIGDGAVQVEQALPHVHRLRCAVLEGLVALACLLELSLAGQTRSSAPHDLHAQADAGDPLLGHDLLYLLRGLVGHADHSTFLATFPARVPPAFLTRPSCPTPGPASSSSRRWRPLCRPRPARSSGSSPAAATAPGRCRCS